MIQQQRGSGSAIQSIVLGGAHVLAPSDFRDIAREPLSTDVEAVMDPNLHLAPPHGSRTLLRWRQIP